MSPVAGVLFADAPADNAAAIPEEVADLYELDEAAVAEALAAASLGRDRLAAELDERVIDQGARLLSLFADPDPASQRDYEQSRAFVALADHWWVQVNRHGAWIDYDLMNPEGEPGQALAAPQETMARDAVPAGRTHRVVLRVVAEQLKDGRLSEHVVLEHELKPSGLIGTRIALRHLPMLWPEDWVAVTPDDVQEKLFAALRTQREWMPALTVGEEALQQFSIRDTGVVNEDPQPQSNPFLALSFPAAGKVGRIVDIFDESFEEMLPEDGTPPAMSGGAPRAEGELTAEWLEYVLLVPGEEPKTVRRELFDLIGPAARQAGDFSGFRMDDDKVVARAGGQMIETEIVMMPNWPAPEFLAEMTARVALANRPVLEEFGRDPFGKSPPNSVELFSKMAAIAGPAYLYASLRSEAGLTARSVFVDRPQIVAQHGVLARVAPGELTAKVALDVVENGVGVDPFDDDAFSARMLQGIADTNAEALALPEGGKNVGEAFRHVADGDEWTVFFPEDESFVPTLGLSPDLAARLVADLRAGNVIISPSASARDVERAGWWRIDPVTGTTLGMGENGWGAVLVEYAFYLTIQVMLAEIACMAYNAAAEPRIAELTAEQGRDKVRAWARQCVSQALLQSLTGMSTAWIQSRFIHGYASNAARTPPPATSGPAPRTGTPSTGPRTAPPSGGNVQPPLRNPPPTNPGGRSADGRNTPPGDQPRPKPRDRKKSEPCRADAGFVKFAYAGAAGRSLSDAPPPFLLAAAPGCPPSPKKNDADAARKIENHTREHQEAHRKEAEAAKNYFDNPTPENRLRYEQAEQARREAGWRELEAWKGEGGGALPPGFKRDPIPSPPPGWDPPPPKGYRTGEPGPVDPFGITQAGPRPAQQAADPLGRTDPGIPPTQRAPDPLGDTQAGPPLTQRPADPFGRTAPGMPPTQRAPQAPPSGAADTQKPGPRNTIPDFGGDTLPGREAGPGVGPHGTLVMGLGALAGAVGNGP